MHICLINAMRQCYKSCPFFIFTQTNEKLPWWPSELPWSLNFQNAMPNKHEVKLLFKIFLNNIIGIDVLETITVSTFVNHVLYVLRAIGNFAFIRHKTGRHTEMDNYRSR